MKKIFWIIAILVASPNVSHAQNAGQKGRQVQKVEALKIAYLKKQLNLSPEEAKKFWPVYKQYQLDLHKLAIEKRKHQFSKEQLQSASEQQINEALDNEFDYQQRELSIRKKYKQSFLKALPPKSVMLLYKAERDFNKRLMRELRKRNEMQMNKRNNKPQSPSGTKEKQNS